MNSKIILNITQHAPSQEQAEAGVKNICKEYLDGLKSLLTFQGIPTSADLQDRANLILESLGYWTDQCQGFNYGRDAVMIGGAPWFMPVLESVLLQAGYKVVYAFSERVSTENPETGVKTSTFNHLGFYKAKGEYKAIDKEMVA